VRPRRGTGRPAKQSNSSGRPPVKRKKRTADEVLRSVLLGSQRAQELRNSSGTPSAAGGSGDTNTTGRRGRSREQPAAAVAAAAGGSKQQQVRGRSASGSGDFEGGRGAAGAAGIVSPDVDDTEVIEISDSD
jgi:hypothetical protein